MSSSDQRQHPRFAIELDAAIVTDGETVAGRTQNLSKGGLCLEAKTPLPLGTPCKTQLALVFSENQFSEHLSVTATVVWCTPTRNGHQIGVKFAPLDAQTSGYLDLFIQFLQGDEEESEGD